MIKRIKLFILEHQIKFYSRRLERYKCNVRRYRYYLSKVAEYDNKVVNATAKYDKEIGS